MKQFEYLRELRENLEGYMTRDEINDILSDYESFFISGKEEGKTEDEISEELGSPAFLAKSLIEEHRRSSGTGKHSSKDNAQPGKEDAEPGKEYAELLKEDGEPRKEGIGQGIAFDEAVKPEGADKRIFQNDNQKGMQQVSIPGRRLCAYLIDAVIAIIPISISSFIAGIMIIPYLLLVSYPSPVAGTLISMSFQAFSTYAVYSSDTYKEVETIREPYYNSDKTNKSDPIISTYHYTVGRGGRRITPFKARIIYIMSVIGIVFYLFYSFACTALLKGQTIGKKIMRIKVQGTNMEPVTAATAFCREFLGKTLINSIPMVAFISLITMLITPGHKTLHDLLTGTVVAGAER